MKNQIKQLQQEIVNLKKEISEIKQYIAIQQQKYNHQTLAEAIAADWKKLTE